jgi:hypothetical protein
LFLSVSIDVDRGRRFFHVRKTEIRQIGGERERAKARKTGKEKEKESEGIDTVRDRVFSVYKMHRNGRETRSGKRLAA